MADLTTLLGKFLDDLYVGSITLSGSIVVGGNVTADATVTALSFQTMTALVALGGGAAPTVGTIGGSGPATAAQNTWLRMLDSTGTAFWVPAWK